MIAPAREDPPVPADSPEEWLQQALSLAEKTTKDGGVPTTAGMLRRRIAAGLAGAKAPHLVARCGVHRDGRSAAHHARPLAGGHCPSRRAAARPRAAPGHADRVVLLRRQRLHEDGRPLLHELFIPSPRWRVRRRAQRRLGARRARPLNHLRSDARAGGWWGRTAIPVVARIPVFVLARGCRGDGGGPGRQGGSFSTTTRRSVSVCARSPRMAVRRCSS